MTRPQRPSLTPSAQRTIDRCRGLMSGNASARRWLLCLLNELFLQESLAAACLSRMGIEHRHLLAEMDEIDRQALPAFPSRECMSNESDWFVSGAPELNDPQEFAQVLDRAVLIARRRSSDQGTSSEDLLLAAMEVSEFVGDLLNRHGVSLSDLRLTLGNSAEVPGERITVDDVFRVRWSDECGEQSGNQIRPPRPGGAAEQSGPVFSSAVCTEIPTGIFRVLDASLNRAREGFRVLEDYSRFIANDAALSWQLKQVRHELVSATAFLGDGEIRRRLLQSRDTAGDVGTALTTAGESRRDGMRDLIIANSRRVQESLRSLEEFGKLAAPDFAAAMKQLRYQCYVIEQGLEAAAARQAAADQLTGADSASLMTTSRGHSRARLERSHVYVLVTEQFCRRPWREVAEQALIGGADVLQLREKTLGDRELADRARWLSDACRAAGALCIVNDRADIARLVGASGLHVGQEELTVAEARDVLHPRQLLGLSTHEPDQARAAVAVQADYLGVGPVFPTATKTFAAHAGLDYVQWCAGHVALPWFAIGGISPANISRVITAGARRVAVTSSVTGSERPADVVRELRTQLQNAG